MLVIALRPVPNQVLATLLADQNCLLKVYQKTTGLYIDVLVGGRTDPLVIGGVACQDRNRIVRSVYLGFQGDLAFFDTRGTENPDYTGLGTRFQLVYIEPSELPPGVG